MHRHGLRPLLLLNANNLSPGPSRHVMLETLAPAEPGSQTVRLASASAALVVPGKTGFDNLTWKGAADVLITAVGPGGLARLSRPLTRPLAAGRHGATTLQYAPFQSPKLEDGGPNPVWAETLHGWLEYVAAVCRLAERVVGPGGYDIEIWNELSFGSQFLDFQDYYAPAEATEEADGEGESEYGHEVEAEEEAEEATGHSEGSSAEDGPEGSNPASGMTRAQVAGRILGALLHETVAFVRNPANAISSQVGISDGFASETPFPSGANSPIGLSALSKHPYVGLKMFPSEYKARHIGLVNALGEADRLKGGGGGMGYIPTYDSLFPESTLTVTHTESLIRDIAPFTTYIYGFPHGREVHPAGSGPIQKWITEFNLGPHDATPVGPDEVTPETGPSAVVSQADREHFEAKVVLRSLVANVNKGITREYFYKAAPGPMSLIAPRFYEALEASPGSYPGRALGGETIEGLHGLFSHMQGPGPSGAARQLSLLAISQEGNHAQFAGDGSEAHPSLYDRQVLAVLPFQTAPKRFVIPVYVMTRDMLTLYRPEASPNDITRFDMPNENFRITLAGLPAGATPAVSAYDPLRGTSTPARLLWREGATAQIEIAATDYPRLLSIEYR